LWVRSPPLPPKDIFMQLKLALIKVALEKGLVEKEDINFEIQSLTGKEVAETVNLTPLPNDSPILIEAIDKSIEDNPKVVKDYLGGKEKSLNKIMGQVMKVTKGRNDAKLLLEVIKSKVAEREV